MRTKKISIGSTVVLATLALTLAMIVTSTRATAQTLTVLYNFDYSGDGGQDPYEPSAGVVFDKAGNIYGPTLMGGPNGLSSGYGTVYELSPAAGGGWNNTVLYTFTNKKYSNGYGPQSSLVVDAAGNLYGTRPSQGADGDGMVFELSPAAGGGWTEQGIHSFNNTNGDAPLGGLIIDASGNLYGTTASGGAYYSGTVFELSPVAGGGWKEQLLHSFKHSKQDGFDPGYTSLTMDAAGNIYGTTTNGGANVSPMCQQGCGTVFEVSPAGDGHWTEKVLHNFNDNGTDGALPRSGVIIDAAGNLYGTTDQGGTGTCKGDGIDGCGTVFELSPATGGGWTESILFNFSETGSEGSYPFYGLTMDAAGNLYGTTGLNGALGGGSIFELSPAAGGGWTPTVLYSFNARGTGPTAPAGSLVFDATGNLYGATSAGGNLAGGGTVYEITP
jgi:uncharacterized repeat protein (TIGR03803 family)